MTRSVRDSSPLDLSAYPALTFDGLERRANYRVIAFREDILHVLEKREAAAILFQILFRWQEYLRGKALEEIEQRRNRGLPPLTPAEVEERLWVYMSYTRFARESGGAVSYNTVIRTLAYLVDKKVIEQRANQNPRTAEYADYEYRINRQVARGLLKGLPEFPGCSSKKGTSGQTTNAAQTDTSSDVTACTQMGTAAAPSSQIDTSSAQTGTSSPLLGTEDSLSGDAIQNILQDSSYGSLQQQKVGDGTDASQAAAATISSLGPFSPEEIALVLAHRRQTASQAIPEPAPAVAATSLDEDNPRRSPDESPNSPTSTLSAEALVALVERKQGAAYDTLTRRRQLTAARTLLDLNLPLDLARFEHLYDASYDEWWKAHYADLHLTHLIERDKHGQLRIMRLLARFQASERKAARPASILPSAQISGDPMIGVSGRPIFRSSGQPLKVLPPAHSPHRRSTIAALGG